MRFLLFFLCSVMYITNYALNLRADAPARYEVQNGDSLWSIANKYLTHPWEWPSLWRANLQISNPNRLYPGAIIELHYHSGNPYLRVLSNGTIKLSPHMQAMPLDMPIPAIPLSDIKPFLNGSLVLDANYINNAPNVIAFTTEHMMAGQGDEVYVKNLCPHSANLAPGVTLSYAIYRPAGIYRDLVDKHILGYKTVLVAYAQWVRGYDPATIVITDLVRGVELQDRVVPNNYPDFDLYFEPKAPSMPVQGAIIDVLGDFALGAVGLVAVIDRGYDAGMQAGDVLSIHSRRRLLPNGAYRYDSRPTCQAPCIIIPPERIGELMVVRVFSHTSIALVVRSTRAIKKFDIIGNP